MAWLEQRGKHYSLVLRLGNQKLKRSLKTDQQKEAQILLDRVERRLQPIEHGDLIVPPEADLMTFLLSDGKLVQPPTMAPGLALGDLCQRYLDSLLEGS